MSSSWFDAAAMYGQWSAYLGVLVAVVVFAAMIFLGVRARGVRSHSVQVTGTIAADPKCVNNGKRGTECRAKVAYSVAGAKHEAQLPVDPFASAGDKIGLLVDPDNPGIAVIDAPNVFLSPLAIGCGVLIIVLSVLIARAAAKNKKFAVASGIFSLASGNPFGGSNS